MPKKRIPIAGQPNFTFITDEALKGYVDLAQQMIFAYQNCDKEKVRVLKEIWKELSDEHTERYCAEAIADIEKQEKEEQNPPKPLVHKVKVVKPIKRIKR